MLPRAGLWLAIYLAMILAPLALAVAGSRPPGARLLDRVRHRARVRRPGHDRAPVPAHRPHPGADPALRHRCRAALPPPRGAHRPRAHRRPPDRARLELRQLAPALPARCPLACPARHGGDRAPRCHRGPLHLAAALPPATRRGMSPTAFLRLRCSYSRTATSPPRVCTSMAAGGKRRSPRCCWPPSRSSPTSASPGRCC
jgi:hypothetical protein